MTAKYLVTLAATVVFLCAASMLQAADMSGAWKGQLASADGSRTEVQIDFSAQGFPLYSYTNNKGLTRQIELSHAGQQVEYVPPGGGVQRMTVKNVERGPGRLSVRLVGSFERASQGYMDQREEAALFEYTLVPEGLKLRITTRTVSHFGDKDMIVGGDPTPVVAEGVLQRLR
ncbi:MAG: hypothetical protein JSR62_07310 [Nitrospira sp.]|nr:hypothetical protein [Nitrospira sp.]